jgi:hypothetical protein
MHHGIRSGQFVGELQHRAMNAAFQSQLRHQMNEENNGAPIPPDILERMTKEKEPDMLWQVMVTDAETKALIPMGPMMNRDAVGQMAEAINKQITTGQRRDWTKAEAYPMTPISNGVN